MRPIGPLSLATIIVVAVLPGALGAQSPSVILAGGVSMSGPTPGVVWQRAEHRFTGAASDGRSLLFALDLPLAHSRVSLRAEELYNRLTSAPNTFWVSPSGELVPRARQDETMALGLATALRARVRPRGSPYFLVGGGLYRSRLRSAATSTTTDEARTYSAANPGYSLGIGLELPVDRRALLIEARFHEMLGRERGTGFVLISAGLRL